MANLNRFKAKNGLDGNNLTIINVADPVNAQDAATKNFSANASNITSGTLSVARGGTGATASTGSGSVVLSTSPTISTPSITFSINATITAGTNAQGQGALTNDRNIITTTTNNPSGVTLPTATAGRQIVVVNRGTNPINVYPASGAAIDSLSANASIQIPVNGQMTFNASSATAWQSSANSTFVAPSLGTPTSINLTNAVNLSLATGVTGTLPVANGGTGATGLTGMLKGSGTSAFTAMTGATNYVAKWTDATSIGNSIIYDSGTNIGISSAAPGRKLDVEGDGRFVQVQAATTGAITLRQNVGDTVGAHIQWVNNANNVEKGWLVVDTSSNMRFATQSTERMRIDSSGNVGIGVATPTWPLHLVKTQAAMTYGTCVNESTAANGGAGWAAVSGVGGAGEVSTVLTSRKDLGLGQVGTFSNFPLAFYTNTTERMRIDSNGNVGIGVTSPSAKLHVNGSLISGSGSPSLPGIGIGDNNSGFFRVSESDSSIGISVSGVERARMNTSGFLLIGYTSSNGSYNLQVNSQIFATSSTIATSDSRYKENIIPLSGSLDDVLKLNPVSFTWKEHPVHAFDRSCPTVGFIAQEVQEVLAEKPYLNSIVKQNECVIQEEEKDVDGNTIKDAVTEEFFGIAEGNMIALLTKAIQELNAKVDAQAVEIAALKAAKQGPTV